MTTITLQDIKSKGANAIPDGQAVYLIVNSRMKSVLVPPDMYEMLMDSLEELEDIRIIEERRGEPSVPFTSLLKKKRK